MADVVPLPGISELEDLIRRSLALADEMEVTDVGIALDKALVELTGAGIAPDA